MPSGKFPQYQFRKSPLEVYNEADQKDPNLRLLLALPREPIVVEFSITIDGLPYQMAREQRVKQLTNDAAQQKPSLLAAIASLAPSMFPSEAQTNERIRHYVSATGTVPSEKEVRWLLDHWIDGPVLLFLNDNFQRFRCNQNPVFNILDRDRDSVVSTDELQRAAESFIECDLNRDGVVQTTEIDQAAPDHRIQATSTGPGKLLFRIPKVDAAALAYEQLAARYNQSTDSTTRLVPRLDQDANGVFESTEITAMASMEPDVTFSIAFNSKNPASAMMKLLRTSSRTHEAAVQLSPKGSSIRISLDNCVVDFSAVQSGVSDQISIGAVYDGYPLLPELDPNDDARYTTRELRDLSSLLTKFDGNHDGKLTQQETQAPLRVCIGLGPLVHGELAAIRSVPTGSVVHTEGPDWFVRMDRNKDDDLTRDEFPGTDEQFATIDTNSDKLISAEEALKSETK